jgi:heme oxygenase
MSLRDLTKDAHTKAERQAFVKVLFSGNINPDLYATFLFNQHPCYNVLEAFALDNRIINDLPDIRRSPYIYEDYEELWEDTSTPPTLLPVVKDYLAHLASIKDDPKKLMAHIYVRHMGDLAGGQMIAKKVPGSGRMYQFTDPDTLKTAIRERISDDMADEAIVCFEFATQMFKEIMELSDE